MSAWTWTHQSLFNFIQIINLGKVEQNEWNLPRVNKCDINNISILEKYCIHNHQWIKVTVCMILLLKSINKISSSTLLEYIFCDCEFILFVLTNSK